MFDRFRFDFDAVLGAKMPPQGGGRTVLIDPLGAPRRSWDRLGSILFSSCGLASIFGRFWAPLGAFWGCSWDRVGPFGGLLGVILAFLDAFWCFGGGRKKHLLIDSTHQLIN